MKWVAGPSGAANRQTPPLSILRQWVPLAMMQVRPAAGWATGVNALPAGKSVRCLLLRQFACPKRRKRAK